VILARVAVRYLPMPAELANAVHAGNVRVQSLSDGSLRYILKADCPNANEVRKAIARRNKMDRAISFLEGAMLAAALIGTCIALFRF
jgi:hypothetical protein